jgi:hypothetical protein
LQMTKHDDLQACLVRQELHHIINTSEESERETLEKAAKWEISGKYFIIHMQNSTTTDILQIQSHEISSLN